MQKSSVSTYVSFAKVLLNLPGSELALVPNDILRIHLMIVKDLRARNGWIDDSVTFRSWQVQANKKTWGQKRQTLKNTVISLPFDP